MDYDELMQRVWSNGSYEHLAPDYLSMAAAVVEVADVDGDDRVLDVACGTGNVAITAARRGAAVTGVDLTPELLEKAAENAELAGVPPIDWREGDATVVPIDDGIFDATLSNLGHMYADPPDAAAAELLRVTRPGGQVAFTSWTPTSLFPFMAGVATTYLDPADLPEMSDPPFMWGDSDVVEDRIGDDVTDLAFETRTARVPGMSPAHVWETHRTHSGVFAELVERVPDADRPALREEMVETIATYFDDETNTVDLEYLLATGRVVG